MPFVIQSSGKWIKNKGSDFYVNFAAAPKRVQKVAPSFWSLFVFLATHLPMPFCFIINNNYYYYYNVTFTSLIFNITFTSLITQILPIKDAGDGKGTEKALLDRIAELESEAQKSFMHRSVLSPDLN